MRDNLQNFITITPGILVKVMPCGARPVLVSGGCPNFCVNRRNLNNVYLDLCKVFLMARFCENPKGYSERKIKGNEQYRSLSWPAF